MFFLDFVGMRTGLVGVLGLALAGGELGGLGSCDSWVGLTGRRAFTAMLAAMVLSVCAWMLWKGRGSSKASFAQGETVEVVGDRGGEDRGVEAAMKVDEVAQEVLSLRLEIRKDLGDIMVWVWSQFRQTGSQDLDWGGK